MQEVRPGLDIKENILERVLRSAMERLGWGGRVGERGPGSLGHGYQNRRGSDSLKQGSV